MSIELIINRKLQALKPLELKCWLKFIISEFFDKLPFRIRLGVLFRVFTFPKAPFNAVTSS